MPRRCGSRERLGGEAITLPASARRMDLAAARWAWEKDRTAGRDSDTLPGATWLFLPMRTGRGTIGIRSWRDASALGIQVLDEGNGIPAGDLALIFEKF